MNPFVLMWIASIVGAGSFAAAGWLEGARRGRRRQDELRASAEKELLLWRNRYEKLEETAAGTEVRHVRTEAAIERSTAELDGALDQLRLARAELATVREDRDRARTDAARGVDELGKARTELSRIRVDLSEAHKERARVEQALVSCKRTLETVERGLGKAVEEKRALESERFSLSTEIDALRKKMASLETVHAEKRALADELVEVKQRLAASCDADVATTLRHDLTVQIETGKARDAEVERLHKENANLRQSIGELDTLRRHVDTLNEELSLMRAAAFAASPSVRPARPSAAPEGTARGQQLQSLVDRIGEMEEVRAAVVTDELGLVVASTGEYGEALAAFGALLAGVGTRAEQILPMRSLHEVSIRDEHKVTVTVRPLGSDDATLALVTMGIGPSAESEVARLIESGP